MLTGIAVVWKEVDRFRTDPNWKDAFVKAEGFLCGDSGVRDKRAVMSLATFLRDAEEARGDTAIDNRTMCGVATALAFAKKGVKPDWEAIGRELSIDSNNLKQTTTDLGGRMNLPGNIGKEFGIEKLRRQAAEEHAEHGAVGSEVAPKAKERVITDRKKSEGRLKVEAFKKDPEWHDAINVATEFIIEQGFDARGSTGIAAIVKEVIDVGLANEDNHSLVSSSAAYIFCTKKGKRPDWGEAARRLGEGESELKSMTMLMVEKLHLPGAVKDAFGVERMHRGRMSKEGGKTPHMHIPSKISIRGRLNEEMAPIVNEAIDTSKQELGANISAVVNGATDKAIRAMARQLKKDIGRAIKRTASGIRKSLAERFEARQKEIANAMETEIQGSGIESAPLRDAAEGGIPTNLAVSRRLEITMENVSKARRSFAVNSMNELARTVPELSSSQRIDAPLHILAGDLICKYYASAQITNMRSYDPITKGVAAAALYYAARKMNVVINIAKIAEATRITNDEMYRGMASVSGLLGLDILPESVDMRINQICERFKVGNLTKAKTRAIYLTAFNSGRAVKENEISMVAASFYWAVGVMLARKHLKRSQASQAIEDFDYVNINRRDVVEFFGLRHIDMARSLRALAQVADISEEERGHVFLKLFGASSYEFSSVKASAKQLSPFDGKMQAAFEKLSAKLMEKYPISATEVERAHELYYSMGAAKGRIQAVRGTHRNVVEAAAGAFLVMACMDNNVPVTIYDVASIADTLPRTVSIMFKRAANAIGLKAKPQLALVFVHEVLRRKGEDYKYEETALRITKDAEILRPGLFATPVLGAASAVCIAVERSGNSNPEILDEVAKLINMHPSVVEENMAEMKKALSNGRPGDRVKSGTLRTE